MQEGGHVSGGGPLWKRLKLGSSVVTPGILLATEGDTPINGFSPATTTVATDSPGLALDTGTYSTTQGDVEGVVTCSVRADLIVRALMSGGAAAGTALVTLSNTLAETAGTTITDADVGTSDMTSGTVWRVVGGESRKITTHNSAVSFVVTVPFTNDIAAADTFLFCPYAIGGDGTVTTDSGGNVQFTTLLNQADASIASGTGAGEAVFWLELNGATDSYVLFINGDHLFSGVNTV